MRTWDGIVLDLDDTLLDTARRLVPAADRRAAGALRDAGARGTVEDALAAIARARQARGGALDWGSVARAVGLEERHGDAARHAFHAFAVPPLALEDDARVALDALGALAPLALLTLGDPDTQRAKVARLGIGGRFVALRYVPAAGPGSKVEALAGLLRERGWSARRTAMVGDSLDSDVRAGRVNGCWTVRVRGHGEWAHQEPREDAERPWRTCPTIADVPALLRDGPPDDA